MDSEINLKKIFIFDIILIQHSDFPSVYIPILRSKSFPMNYLGMYSIFSYDFSKLILMVTFLNSLPNMLKAKQEEEGRNLWIEETLEKPMNNICQPHQVTQGVLMIQKST